MAGNLSRHARVPTAFTLVETLVVVAIIALLLAILLPAVQSVRVRMKALVCASNMRSIVFKFHLFAGGVNREGRGDSEILGPGRFYIGDFQESVYRIDEFWDLPIATGLLESQKEMMLCPAGPRTLSKQQGFPCSNAAVFPARDVTIAMNMRLYRASLALAGSPVLAPAAVTHVRSNVLGRAYVPLVMDVDGAVAADRGIEPFYTAPPLTTQNDAYADGLHWMPSKRHAGRTVVGFVGGHVLSSARPEQESWNWSYQADVGN